MRQQDKALNDGSRNLLATGFVSRSVRWARAWLTSRTALTPIYDGTIASLIDFFQNDPGSKFARKKLQPATRANYGSLCRRLDTDIGTWIVAEITAREVDAYYEAIAAQGKVPMAHALIGMLRNIATFGATTLDNKACAELSGKLSRMRFAMGKPRAERLTADHVIAIRAAAHKRRFPSMALGQSIQFEAILRQKDVIGDWWPVDEAPDADIVIEGFAWVRGIRWESIGPDLVLRHITSKRGKPASLPLIDAPMVMEELRRMLRVGPGVEINREMLPASGPIIIFETTGQPYRAVQWRRLWRDVATAAGVPKHIRNQDSRAGGISEAIDAGVAQDHVRQAATHSNSATTARYTRNQEFAAKTTLQGRVAHRSATLVPDLPLRRSRSTARRKTDPQPQSKPRVRVQARTEQRTADAKD